MADSRLSVFLQADVVALGHGPLERPSPLPYADMVWKFQRLYRRYEFCRATMHHAWQLPYVAWLKLRFDRLSQRLGFGIPLGVFGPGLSIAHYGTIVVNGNARIGRNCRIQENVTIGATNGSSKAPRLGNNVFIGSGARIIGDIEIADDIAIGAGSVVTQSFTEPGITIAGVPARKISDQNSHCNLNPAIFEYNLSEEWTI